MNILTIVLWALGLAYLVLGGICGLVEDYDTAIVMMLWAFPAGCAAGTAFAEL